MKKYRSIIAGLLLVAAGSCKKGPGLENPPNGGGNPGGITTNRPPVANAGADTSITLPLTTAALDGRGSSDSDNNITGYYWTKISGPASFMLPGPSAPWTAINLFSEGPYEFELKVTDSGGLVDRDTVKVSLLPYAPPVNCQDNWPEIPVQPVEINNLPGHVRWPRMFNTGNSLVVVATGDYYLESERKVYVFNKSTMQWTTSAISENLIRTGWGIIAANSKLYFAGGMKYNPDYSISTYSGVEIYDIATTTWSSASLSEPRAFVNAIVADNKIFFAGGMKADRSFSKRVDILDLNTSTWSATQLAGTPRAITGAAATNTKIYFCGGYTEFMNYTGYGEVLGLPVPAIDVYDLTARQWSVESMSHRRENFGTISKNGTVYLAGGYDNTANAVTAVTEAIHSANAQRSFSCMSGPNTFAGNVTSFNNWLIFYGDNAFLGTVPDRLELFNTQNGKWSIGKLPAGMFQGGYWTSMVADNNKIYLVAGDKLYELDF